MNGLRIMGGLAAMLAVAAFAGGGSLLFAPSGFAAEARSEDDSSTPTVLLAGFEASAPGESIRGRRFVAFEREGQHATQGGHALRVDFSRPDRPSELGPTILLDPPVDFSRYRLGRVDVFNPQAKPVEFGVRYPGFRDFFVVAPGRSTVEFPLRPSGAVSEIGLPMRFYSAKEMASEVTTIYFDNLRLESLRTFDQPGAVDWFFGKPISLGRLFGGVPARRAQTTVRVDVCPQDAQGLTARVGWLGQTLDAPVVDGQCSLDLPVATTATTATLELIDASGAVRWRGRQYISYVAPAPDQVGFDESGRCYVGGRPFFPIGIFAPNLPDFALYKEMGFNCAGPYRAPTEDYLKAAKTNGLLLLSEPPAGRAFDPANAKTLADGVAAIEDRGVILGYYVYDEPKPGGALPVALALRRSLALVGADERRIVAGVNNSNYTDYAGCVDAMMVDAYGLPDGFSQIVSRMKLATGAMRGRGPVWLVPQAYGKSVYCHGADPSEAKGRAPTYDELRSQQWLGVILGAQGVFWYSANIQGAFSRYQWPISWEGLRRATQELSALHDVLVKAPLTLRSDNEKVFAGGRYLDRRWPSEAGDDALVIVVNTSDQSERATISGLRGAGLKRLDGKGEVSVRDGAFSDTLEPRTTRLYASRALGAPLPDVASVRDELNAKQEAFARQMALDAARHESGARLQTSWGLPEKAPGYAWRRIIDGRRGTFWQFGAPGYFLRKETQWPADKTERGERWVEVALPQPADIERVVVTSLNCSYDLLGGMGGDLKPLAGAVTTTDGLCYQQPVEVAEFELTPPRRMDRLRLRMTRDAAPDKPELLFEIEMRRVPSP